jgi:hypothetical protein
MARRGEGGDRLSVVGIARARSLREGAQAVRGSLTELLKDGSIWAADGYLQPLKADVSSWDSAMHEEQRIGKHRFVFEPPDTCFVTYVGDVSADDCHGFKEVCWNCAAGRRYLLLLLDQRRLGTISPEVRKVTMEAMKGLPVRGTAVMGASFEKRVINGFVNKGLNLVLRLDNPLRFFDTEERARDWLRERRLVLSAQGG